MLFAYVGPEVMLPVASVITGVVGVFLMFGRSLVGFGRGVIRRVIPGSDTKTAVKAKPVESDWADKA